MGISGFLNQSNKKKDPVYLVGHDNESVPPTNFTAIQESSYPSSTRTVARVVALFELFTTLVFWVPILDIPQNLYLLYCWTDGNQSLSRIYPEWDVVLFMIACTISRFLASALLLFGTYKSDSIFTVPYLLVQILFLFGGPFVLMYSSLGFHNKMPLLRYDIGWVAMIPLIVILIRFEYIKWRSVYYFYDALSAKHVTTEFAKLIDNSSSDTRKVKEAGRIESEWYVQQTNKSATMREIDAKEAEALVSQNVQ